VCPGAGAAILRRRRQHERTAPAHFYDVHNQRLRAWIVGESLIFAGATPHSVFYWYLAILSARLLRFSPAPAPIAARPPPAAAASGR